MFTFIIVSLVIAGAIVGGALIYRNNQKRLDAAAKAADALYKTLKKK